jgi:hypothetical protein
MSTTTRLGPIGINQINTVYYVGGDGFPTIQSAVDFIQNYNAGVGQIVILPGYTGSEVIGNLVRGSANTYISDQRTATTQNWEWNGSAYVPAPGGGGGGGGGVNPGAQGKLSFYAQTGAMVSPSLITTDAATQSNLTIPGLMQAAQATTNYAMFPNRGASAQPYVQEQTISVVAGSGINIDGGPVTNTINVADTMYQAVRGIAQIHGGFIERHAIGDTAGLYYYVRSDGGIAAGADEGITGISVKTLENLGYFHGTVGTTTGNGDQAPTWNWVSGQAHTSDGAFMLNISKGQIAGNWSGMSVATSMDTGSGATATGYLNQLPVTNLGFVNPSNPTGPLIATAPAWVSTIHYAAGTIVSESGSNYVSLLPGNIGNNPASSPTQWAVLPGGQLPISTAIGIATAAIPGSNAPSNAPVSQTITVNLVKINGVFPAFAVNDVVSVASDRYPEQSRITAASATSIVGAQTRQTLTMLLRNPSTKAILFKGGIAGQFISMDANLSFNGMRSSYYAFGSQTGTDLIYGFNMNGTLTGRILPQYGCEPASTSGANSGFHLFPGAEIVANPTFDYAGTLEQNGVMWQAGDTVENPHYPAWGGAGIGIEKFQQTPAPAGFGSQGLVVLLDGPGFCGSAMAIGVRSNVPSTNFFDDGGPVAAPGGIQLFGVFNYGLQMTSAPQQAGAALMILEPAAPVNNPNAIVHVVQINYSTGGNLNYDPSLSLWSVSGNFDAGNGTFNGNLAVGGFATFMTGAPGGGMALDGSNDYTEIKFSLDDGSGVGVPQRIMAYHGGYPFNPNMYYDNNNSGLHLFRASTGYGSSTYTLFASIGPSGMTVNVGILDAPAYSVAGTAGASGSFTSADATAKTITVTNGLITAIV